MKAFSTILWLGIAMGTAFGGKFQMPPVATNMCLSLHKKIISNKNEETLRNLNDGLDATVWNATGPFWVAIQINAKDLRDAEYLMVHYRSAGTSNWNDASQSLNKYKIMTSHNSTNGFNGDWKTVKRVRNQRRDKVDVIKNNRPKWIKIVESSDVSVSLSRLDVFRAAPKGMRNDYWIFFGASVIASDLIVGWEDSKNVSLFSDIIHSFYPDRYPIVINSSESGELIQKGVKRQARYILPENPKGTFFTFHHGGNNVSKMRPFPGGQDELAKSYRKLITNAQRKDFVVIPSRLTFRNYEEVSVPHFPHTEYNGSLPYNLEVIDPIIRELTPYAVERSTGNPIMDPYAWYRENQNQLSDSVHHDMMGAIAMNELFAMTASKIVYEPLESHLYDLVKNSLEPHYSRHEIVKIPPRVNRQVKTAEDADILYRIQTAASSKQKWRFSQGPENTPAPAPVEEDQRQPASGSSDTTLYHNGLLNLLELQYGVKMKPSPQVKGMSLYELSFH